MKVGTGRWRSEAQEHVRCIGHTLLDSRVCKEWCGLWRRVRSGVSWRVVWRVCRWVGLVLRSWFVRFMCKQASKLVHVFVSCVCANLQNDAHAHAHKESRTAAWPLALTHLSINSFGNLTPRKKPRFRKFPGKSDHRRRVGWVHYAPTRRSRSVSYLVSLYV